MFVITLITASITLIFIITQYLTIDTNYWKKRNIKQVNGVFWKFITGKQAMPEIIKSICDAHPKVHHVGIFLGKTPTLIVRDIENIKTVLYGDFQSFYSRGLIRDTSDIFTDSLIFMEDYKRWKLQRLKMSPFLTQNQMKNMFYATERCAKDFVDYIESNRQTVVDPYEIMYTYTTACVSSTILGIETDRQNPMETPLNKIVYESLNPDWKFKIKFALAGVSPKLYKFLNLKIFGDYQQGFFDAIKKAMEKRKNDTKIHHDFIDTCLKYINEGVLKDFVTGYETHASLEFLASQASVFVLAGIDTVSTVLYFTLLELANYPQILKKVHDEIDEIFKGNMNKITFEDLDKMVYMTMVINETMRKYPPVGLTQRKCCKKTVLPNGNIEIEKGTKIIIPIFTLHRDKNYFPNPDVFDPERFSEKNVSKIVKYSYIPFGEGKRICIGTRLAYMQMKVCLAWLFRRYTLKEQSFTPKQSEPSFFSIRDQSARCEFIPRNLPLITN